MPSLVFPMYSCLLFFVLCLATLPSFAADCSPWAAKVDSIQGTVEAKRSGQTSWQPVKPSDTFCAGDSVHVLEKSRAAIILSNETVLRLDQGTTITFSASEKEKTTWYDILKGKAYFLSRTPKGFKVNTPFLNAGIEGTEFLVAVNDTSTLLSVMEGKVRASNNAGSILLAGNQTAVAESGKAPEIHAVARPMDAVQWTLHYPPLPFTEGWQRQIAELLAVGRADEAKGELEKVLGREPQNSHALSWQSIIALTQNEKEKATTLAKRAVDAAPNSAAALIALSYVKQADNDLKGALVSLQSAVSAEPNNALAWARLSEIHLSFGDRDEAMKAAAKAAELDPNLARTQSVLGYAYLAQVKTGDAKAAFSKAAALDPADPLPRLGMGLALIREGKLEEGRREIEVAVTLDPADPIIRSYLGKAYYEEKRDKVAGEQYEMAIERDPNDPTPYYYSAIQKQTQNRPVEALHDLQKAIELNDNRAVYRSRLLLDNDHAARSASLARIYSDLGFQQLALAEGWRALSADPADYSAHRLLADSYSRLPRHEIGRVSELLQAQLLQPLNVMPLQPHLAEANSYILSGAGPSALSYNEFNPLFSRNKFTAQLSGISGSHSTRGQEFTAAGMYGKLMVSAGRFYYETDGFRENNDLEEGISNVFAQYAVSDSTSVQVEHRETTKSYGDLPLRFYRDNFSTTARQKDELRNTRIGLRHAFGPGSELLGNFGWQNSIGKFHDSSASVTAIDVKVENYDSSIGELQYLKHKENFSVIGGGGRVSYDSKTSTNMELVFPPITISSVNRSHVSHRNVYLYSQINYLRNLSLIIGVSDDQFRQKDFDRYSLNPKAGITWTPTPSTTVRGAIFKTLKRTLTTNQTLEPTQIAGFNQFFDENSYGTTAWNYGVAVDHAFLANLRGGGSFLWRRLDVPVTVVPDGITPAIQTFDWREQFGRTYLYWTPHNWLATNVEYLYERFDRAPNSNPEVCRVETHRFPVGIIFNHPSGFRTHATATYVMQEGKFSPRGSTLVSTGESGFWIVDAALSYRLPNRGGIVSLVGKNIFDRKFKYQDMNPVSPELQPDRSIFLKFTIIL
ncbi:MAG: tetratricopeptide repeat protein [Nitrospirota bacterium]|nr:tetratricopeptide repeat protein [Nitrospirota bacterium]